MMYLIEVKYRNDNERKRLDYLVSKWRNKIYKPEGYLLQVDDDMYSEVISEIVNKFPIDIIFIYKISKIDLNEEKYSESRTFKLQKELKEAKSFMSYLISKKKGVFLGNSGEMEIYDIYTRKGIVRLYMNIKGDSSTSVFISLTGGQEAVRKLLEELTEEIKIFGDSK